MKPFFRLLAITSLAVLCASASAEDIKDSITITQIDPESPKKPLVHIDASSSTNDALISKTFEDANKVKTEDRIHIGRNASYILIEITRGNNVVTLASLHPLYEGKLPVVATPELYPGLNSLNDRKLEDVIKEQPQSFQEFRRTFDSIYSTTVAASKKDSDGALIPR